MNFFTYRITLDMHSPTTQAVMNVKRNDSKRKFYFDLTDGGKPYTITEQCTAVFRGRKPDGNVLYNSCVIEDNEIIYELTNQTVSTVGLVDCEVTLYDAGGNQITSPRFVIRVNDILDSDSEVESQNEFTELATALGQVTALNMSMDGKTITFTNKDGESSTLSFSDKADGMVTVTFTDTDGNVSTFNIYDGEKGEKGDTGDTGAQGVPGRDGADGQDGSDGTDGISITNVTINAQHHLIVTLSNGNTIDAGEIEGGSGASSANQVSITDEEDYYTSNNVEGALAEIGENLYEIGEDIEYINRAVSLKQDKSTLDNDVSALGFSKNAVIKKTTEGAHVYAHTGETQNEYAISNSAIGSTVAVRDSNGHLKATTPTENNHVANKGYVDDALEDKQDVISDLATIRSGAAAGATALQSVPNTYRTASAQDLIDAGKQDKLTAGTGISISGGVISCTFDDGNGVSY